MNNLRFYINIEENKIYGNTEIISETKIECVIIDIEQLQQLIFEKDLAYIFICLGEYRGKKYLEPISVDGIKNNWIDKYSNNICLDSDGCELTLFPKGYCYIPELWSDSLGRNILIFNYCH